ncbi:pupal cuticle protein C1B-like [Atheta coriaria]|uniref:pupal cuticle protein C1B-like n=1 Tax=Dalotia coriaria TaxID=877792 RepID=UPI0031F4037F
MFKYIALFFAVLAVAFAAPKPGFVAPYVAASPIAYSAGYVAPAYSAHYTAPVAAAYASPYAYSAYSAYTPYAYAY